MTRFKSVRKLIPWSAALLMMISTISCAPQTVGDSACVAFRPIYLSEQSIAAMPRADKEKVAAHNRTWEGICP